MGPCSSTDCRESSHSRDVRGFFAVQLRRLRATTDFSATRTVPSLDGDFRDPPSRRCPRVMRDVSWRRTTSSRQGRLPSSTATSLTQTRFLLRDQRHFFAASAIASRHQQTSSQAARIFFSRDQSSDPSDKRGCLRDREKSGVFAIREVFFATSAVFSVTSASNGTHFRCHASAWGPLRGRGRISEHVVAPSPKCLGSYSLR